MREAGIDTIVFSSTCAVYGCPEAVPVRETALLRPVNPYGETKLAIERALYWYGEAYGMRAVALRYFNAAGADPDGEIGELHEPETHLVPLAIQGGPRPGRPDRDLRRRLPDRRWHGRARLYSCCRSRRRPCSGARPSRVGRRRRRGEISAPAAAVRCSRCWTRWSASAAAPFRAARRPAVPAIRPNWSPIRLWRRRCSVGARPDPISIRSSPRLSPGTGGTRQRRARTSWNNGYRNHRRLRRNDDARRNSRRRQVLPRRPRKASRQGRYLRSVRDRQPRRPVSRSGRGGAGFCADARRRDQHGAGLHGAAAMPARCGGRSRSQGSGRVAVAAAHRLSGERPRPFPEYARRWPRASAPVAAIRRSSPI